MFVFKAQTPSTELCYLLRTWVESWPLKCKQAKFPENPQAEWSSWHKGIPETGVHTSAPETRPGNRGSHLSSAIKGKFTLSRFCFLICKMKIWTKFLLNFLKCTLLNIWTYVGPYRQVPSSLPNQLVLCAF